MSERIVKERRARATGTTVQLVDRGADDVDQRWETICVDHGGVCSHETRRLAEGWLAHPDEWCEDCMHGPGTLDGTAPLEDPTTTRSSWPSEDGAGNSLAHTEICAWRFGGKCDCEDDGAETAR